MKICLSSCETIMKIFHNIFVNKLNAFWINLLKSDLTKGNVPKLTKQAWDLFQGLCNVWSKNHLQNRIPSAEMNYVWFASNRVENFDIIQLLKNSLAYHTYIWTSIVSYWNVVCNTSLISLICFLWTKPGWKLFSFSVSCCSLCMYGWVETKAGWRDCYAQSKENSAWCETVRKSLLN